MNKHEELALKYFNEGYNCAQSVFAAFHEEMGMDEKTAFKMSAAFGGGMGGLREVCGAVTGMFMVLSNLYGYDDAKELDKKKVLFGNIQALAEEFKKEHDTIICRDLLASPRAKDFQPKGHHAGICFEYVKTAARLTSEFIEQN